jgi:3-hydroxyisobutyrate dehydrogenase-like beta-hydroxyacid dehydrogenase
MKFRRNNSRKRLPRVAILGTGKMGGAMARRLYEGGFRVSVWDRTRSKAEALGVGDVAASPADAVGQADVVISMVTGPEAVRDLYLGAGGVLEAAPGKTLVEMSTAGPDAALELAQAAAERGVTLIEAPVVGSTPAVASGTLVILAAADLVDDLDVALPVLERLGEVHYVGPLGTSASLKLVANSFLAITSAAAAELMAAGSREGLDPNQVFDILTRAAPGLRAREAGFVRHQYGPAMFATRDLLKDLDLGLQLYRDGQGSVATVPLTAVARELYARVAALAPDLDISAITNAYSTDLEAVGQQKEVA